LHPGMAPGAVQRTFADMLETVPYAAGVNNHEGSLGTADQKLMDELMPLLHERNLFFIDSRTTVATVAETAAHAAGVAAARRNVFLDDQQSVPAIRKQFELAIRDAREKGSALAIGHPHPATLEVLNEMLPEAQRDGVRLVYASDLAH
ncbi:MAG TPA: divergent polysaccharide deacetylase family protein, partial [Candidatus Acidoferrales bacterium]|nr:divergent polysaccharide deacetylase family protein [Candidatus Acidoferrales bacterium]